MKVKIADLNNNDKGAYNLKTEVFAVSPNNIILNNVINWQRANWQSGTHKVKERGEVSGTTKKPFKQKGTGNARLGSLRAAQCRGGGIIFGPLTRSHAFKLPKKVVKLGLKMALSIRKQENRLTILENTNLDKISTKTANSLVKKIGTSILFVVDDLNSDKNKNFVLSIRNIKNTKILPHNALNVYDILKFDHLVLDQTVIKNIEGRLT